MKKIIAIAFAAVALPGCSVLSQINWNPQQLVSAASKAATAMSITDAQVVQLSAQSVAEMDAKNKIAGSTYSNRLGKLLSGVTVDGLKLNFKVYDTPEINAFACADGFIRVYSGLMDVMDDNELMAIIGHVVHQDQRMQ